MFRFAAGTVAQRSSVWGKKSNYCAPQARHTKSQHLSEAPATRKSLRYCSSWTRSTSTIPAVTASAVADADPSSSDTSSSTGFWKNLAVALAKVADDTKCEDIIVLDVDSLVNWTSFLVICTAYSRPQLLAVLGRMEKLALEEWSVCKQNNSIGTSPWECLDFGSVVVHCFTPEERERYDVEGFYAAAEEVDLPFASKGMQDALDNWKTSSKISL